MTIHAMCAKQIRQDLKKAFPEIKFSVRSESFAGGDAINITYENGIPECKIEEVVEKYIAGHYNSMEDIYEYKKNEDNIPRVKYLHVCRELSPDKQAQLEGEFIREYCLKDFTLETFHKKFGNYDKCLEFSRFIKDRTI